MDHGNDSSSDVPADILVESITQALSGNKIGLRNLWGQRNYFPDRDRTKLITKDAIRKALPSATTNLVDYIHNYASKTFSMVLMAIEGRKPRLEAMQAFYFHGLRDSEHLPVPNIAAKDCCEHSWQKSDREKCHSKCTASLRGTCKHLQVYNCFHHSCWDITRFYKFWFHQPSFVMQHFNTKVFQHHNISDDRVLPFLPREGMEPIAGGFGKVYPAKMLVDYLIDREGLIDVHSTEEINIAIKVLKPDEQGRYNLEEEWERESNAHKDLNGLDTHLIKAFAAFRYRGDFCLLLEWADGGSLQSLLKQELRPFLTKEAILELLDQLVGLANAMHLMHNKDFLHPVRANSFESFRSQTGDDRSVDAVSESRADQSVVPVIPQAITVTSEGSDVGLVPKISIEPPKDLTDSDGRPEKSFENWRHGDIKPANILRFKGKDVHGKDLWLGTLKLADLGRAKQRNGITRYQTKQEVDNWRSEAHEAPDIHVNPHASMSRLYDSWSMGTVIFNLIVWMLYGKQQLHNFTHTTDRYGGEGSPYWTRRYRTSAEVSAMAKLWMSHILREDIECNRPEGTVMGDLMKLVRDELLVIDLPPLDSRDIHKAEKGQRSNAARLCDRLKEIRERAHKDEEYLFTGNDRSGMQPPPSGDAAVAEITVMRLETVADQKVSGLLSPNAAEDRALNTRQRNTYTHGLEDKWLYEDDNHFARSIMELDEVTKAELAPDDDESDFCKTCQSFKAMSLKFFTRSVPDLDRSCPLCQMLKGCVERLGLDLGEPLVLDRSGGSYITPKTGRAVLRVCREPQPSYPSHFGTEGIPVGLPLLSHAGDSAHVAILKAWLRDCDNSDQHKRCRLSKSVFVPKRLLQVEKNSRWSKVIETASHLSDKSVDYLALSHPWGKASSTNVHFKSDKDNIKKRMTRIRDAELPLTFRDAVEMARKLEVQYIWIDSICILQKTDTDPGDFQEEAKSMESIYASAYCVISASSAEGMNSGFWSDERLKGTAIQLPQAGKGDLPATYLCDTIDDFQGDVLDGPLNERGWALQERALARRTIFFTKTQTYWECGQGIRCETLSKLTNQKVKFIGDSNFPSYANSPEGRGRGAQEFLFEELYADYSRLKFSLLTDKPIAISGLEQRLTRAIRTPSGAGIFIKFWGRCLLWKRNDPEVTELVRISSGTIGSKVRMPPSWSWMAYEGGISYLQPPKGRTVWNEKAIRLRLTGSGEISWLFAKDELGFSAPIKSFKEGENTADGDYQLTYDNPNESKSKQKKCVIIGSVQDVGHAEKGIHYVLVVSPVATKGSSNTWERIGAGKLHGRFIQDVNAVSVSAEIV
ncbi:hypothetical protein GJ744_008334 [Endocarpon pusillum]|uniref:Protein kinase domain-containing protein n=1 Tax=Endocarpon pusillum TaxID=364733 RepID=A0A8H7ALF2_9EURO|nr:hypothetical protein GJ744_008334 [Endocarpon pusillum]